ncbi:MAG: ABC transporter permease [Candidatus Cloacimonetes bacterium]|nr:ABC transporter permease [Candidatus Cloacimonadota bacterium]
MKILAYIIKDLKIFLKSKSSVLLTFIVPMIIIFIFGSIFSSTGKEMGINPIRVLAIDQDKTNFSKSFLQEIDDLSEINIIDSVLVDNQPQEVTIDIMNDLIKKGKIRLGVVIPKNFEIDSNEGNTLNITINYDPQYAIEQGILTGMIQQTLFSKYPYVIFNSIFKQSEKTIGKDKNSDFKNSIGSVVKQYFPIPGKEMDFDSYMKVGFNSTSKDSSNAFNLSESVNIETVAQVGEEVENQMFAQYVAGMAVMFLLFSLNAVASSLLEEKKTGTLKRILISPTKAIEVILGKMLFCIILGTLQLIVLFIFGYLVFDLNIFRDMFSLLVVILATAMASTSIGMFLATICKTERQVSSLSTLIVLSMSALGGSMVPSFIMPLSIQTIGKFTLNHWAMKGFTDIFWRQLSFMNILPSVIILILIFLVFTGLSLFFYNKWSIQN